MINYQWLFNFIETCTQSGQVFVSNLILSNFFQTLFERLKSIKKYTVQFLRMYNNIIKL